jgi:predicted Zn-dependent peptidase
VSAVSSRDVGQIIKWNKFITLEERLAIYQKMTMKDINDIAKKYLDINKMLVATVGK